MKSLLFNLTVSTLIVVSAPSVFAAKAKHNSKLSSKVATVEVNDVSSEYPESDIIPTAGLMDEGRSANEESLAGAAAYLDAADVIVDKVINIGTKVWNVLEKGRATFNLANMQANALPDGAKRWDQLQRWNQPTSKVYSVTAKNIYGVEILRFDYRIILLAGGDVGGVGRYIGYATVQPVKVKIPYLTNFDVTVKVDSVYNTGTAQNPVAGMIMNISINARSVIPLMPTDSIGHSLILDGNGGIRTM